jgi:hypothetical protein
VQTTTESPAKPSITPSADRYDQLYRDIQQAQRDPLYRSGTHEGMEFRDHVLDLERELERHKPAAIAKAQSEINARNQKVDPAKPSNPGKVTDRRKVNAADLAAEYKSRGIDRQRAWSQFVIDRGLNPGIDAKEFYRIYDSLEF